MAKTRKPFLKFLTTWSLVLCFLAGPLAASAEHVLSLEDELAHHLQTTYYDASNTEVVSAKSTSFLSRSAETLSWALGASLRTTGDYLRTPSPGSSPEERGLYAPIGNFLRGTGALFVEETRTLERSILSFWVEKSYMHRPDIVIPTTVSTLFAKNNSIDEILRTYRKLLETIILRDYLEFLKPEPPILNGYFIKGLICGFARTPDLHQSYTVEVFTKTLLSFNLRVDDILRVKFIPEISDLDKASLAACQSIFEDEQKKIALEKTRSSHTPPTSSHKSSSPISITHKPSSDPAPPPHGGAYTY